MVKVRETFPSGADGRVDIPAWLDQLGSLTPLRDRELILDACKLAQSIADKAEADGSLCDRRRGPRHLAVCTVVESTLRARSAAYVIKIQGRKLLYSAL